jgi:hypothetical protein
MSLQNEHGNLDNFDQAVLDDIEHALAKPESDVGDADTFIAFCATLARTTPKPDPMFQQRLEAQLVALREQHQGGTVMRTTPVKPKRLTWHGVHWTGANFARSTMRALAVCSVALLCTTVLLAAAPAARAEVLQVLERFGLVLVDSTTPPVAVPAAPDAGELPHITPQELVPQKLDHAAAQQQVPFPIRLPTWLPEGMQFDGVIVGTGGFGCSTEQECATARPPVWTSAGYRHVTQNDVYLTVEATEITATSGGGYEASAAAAQDATVHGLPAVYVQGDRSMLSWEEHDLTYVITVQGVTLTQDELVRVAESLR